MSKRTMLIAGVGAMAMIGALSFLFLPRTIRIAQKQNVHPITASLPEASKRLSPQAGEVLCKGEQQLPRAIAVMLAGDIVARPLSGIGQADIVVEMPVVTGSVNRFMAIFQCKDAAEIGSVRSARDDFIPLAAAFDAVYAHWGGSHFALDQLRGGIIDDIDALRNPFGAYFRKSGIPAPHNGFTSFERLRTVAEKLGYRTTSHFSGFPAIENHAQAEGHTQKTTVLYPASYRVVWEYDSGTGRYARRRGGTPEIDASTKQQVTAGTIVIMRTTSRQIEGQYNDIRIVGEGKATVLRLGEAVEGRWQKEASPLSAPLRFLDVAGTEIPFAEGPLWIEIIDQTESVQIE